MDIVLSENSQYLKDRELVASQIEKIKSGTAIFYYLEEMDFMLEKVIQECENN
ncbi:MAG: hypothetical protein WC272_02845 [Sulfurimonas sp.]|jgi:ABC-type Zn uptake system ZnuABC Zn-binding protein ZnuA